MMFPPLARINNIDEGQCDEKFILLLIIRIK